MKKIIAFLILLLCLKQSYAQYPLKQYLGSDSTLVTVRGGMNARLVLWSFTDTTQANTQRINQYAGALIYTTGTDKVWYRNSTATGWIEFTSSGGSTVNIYNSDGDLTGERQLGGNGYNLRFNDIREFGIGTDSLSVVLNYPKYKITGLSQTTDTTTYKPLAIDADGYFTIMDRWPGGGGSAGWALTGNEGTNPSANYIGTNDDVGLLLKVGGKKSGYISSVADDIVIPAGDVHLGQYAGEGSDTTVLGNTLVGNGAGRYIGQDFGSTGLGISTGNTFLGNWAGYFTQHPDIYGFGRNVFIGASSGFNNIRGGSNFGGGTFTLELNNAGSGNTATGRDALRSNIDGFNNTANGSLSLLYNTTGIGSVTVTNGGSGYTTATVTISPPYAVNPTGACGDTATAVATINAGMITAITITDPGCGYSYYGGTKYPGYPHPPVTVTITGDGTGATATANVISGENNTAAGVSSGLYNRLGYGNSYFGNSAGASSRYKDSLMTFLGTSADVSSGLSISTNISKSTAIGYNAKVRKSKNIILGATGSDQPIVVIGRDSSYTLNYTGSHLLDVNGNIKINGIVQEEAGVGYGNYIVMSQNYKGYPNITFGVGYGSADPLNSGSFGISTLSGTVVIGTQNNTGARNLTIQNYQGERAILFQQVRELARFADTTGNLLINTSTDEKNNYYLQVAGKTLLKDTATFLGQISAVNLPASGTSTDSALTVNRSTGYFEMRPVAGGGTYTFTNGLTNSSGTVKLGGTLTEGTTTLDGGTTNTLRFQDMIFEVANSNTIILGDSISLTGGATPNRLSDIKLKNDTIKINPGIGLLYIDTLTSAVGTKALRYNPTTGLVSYADTTGGGSDGYVDNVTFNTTTNYLTIEQTGAADVSVRIPPSYIINPINADSLTRIVNDSTLMVKAVVIADTDPVEVTTVRNDSLNTHTIAIRQTFLDSIRNGDFGGGSPGGSDTYVQFNDGGVFGGDAGFNYNKTDNELKINTSTDNGAYKLQGEGGMYWKLDGTNAYKIVNSSGSDRVTVNASSGNLDAYTFSSQNFSTSTGGNSTFSGSFMRQQSGAYFQGWQQAFSMIRTYPGTGSSPQSTVIFDNTTETSPASDYQIATFKLSGTSVAFVDKNGKYNAQSTVTAGGTTGNQTINKPTGTVNIAAAGSTVTVTNSTCTANSIVYAVLRTNDATATGIKSVVPSAGSFVITLNAAATAEVSVGFIVFN